MAIRERYKRHILGDKPRFLYEYYVSGRGEFPFDMLRYDAAWPATSEDAIMMSATRETLRESGVKLRSILIHSYSEPTIERWSSFMWSVGAEKL